MVGRQWWAQVNTASVLMVARVTWRDREIKDQVNTIYPKNDKIIGKDK